MSPARKDKTFHISTYGCQMNEHDSEMMAGLLEKEGYRKVSTIEEAQVEIINTCSVRDNADKRFFGRLGLLKARKESDPSFLVCVCGCMMQQQPVVDAIKNKYPWVDLVFGTRTFHMLPAMLREREKKSERCIAITEEGTLPEGLPADRLYRHKAYVNIMYGCNNFCTYCIVPYTRGREVSRKPDAIIAEIRGLVEDGVREVMLLGQNVNSYGGGGSAFTSLLHRIDEIEGLERVRFMTSHPKDLSDELIASFRSCSSLCHHIHLPVQSGSDRVLHDMNRHYTRSAYLNLVEKLRKAAPDICLSTDIIVGFPGEREEDFSDTLALVDEVGYDSAFTFLYSIRPGTPAARRTDQVPEAIKHERFDRLVDHVNRLCLQKNRAYVGRREKVLVDGPAKRAENMLCGRTNGYKLVNFPGGEDLTGTIQEVRIREANTFSLVGERVL